MENLRSQTRKNNSFFLKVFSGFFGKELRPHLAGSGAAIAEMKAVLSSKYYFTKHDIEVLTLKPEETDVLVICGTITKKYLPYLIETYNRILEPKWVIWLGSSDGKSTHHQSYGMIADLEKYIDIDVFVPGEPPVPEQIMDGFLQLRDLIKDGR